MIHKNLLLKQSELNVHPRQIARQLYFLTSSKAFEDHYELQLNLYEKICEQFNLPLSSIKLIGSGHTGFSLVKGTDFDKEKSDLDIAIVSSSLYLELFELAYEQSSGWRDVSKFPGVGSSQTTNKNSFLKYLRKGIIRPDLMPSSPRKAEWENFFGNLSSDFSKFCNGISAGVYAKEFFMAAKQESAIQNYINTQGSI